MSFYSANTDKVILKVRDQVQSLYQKFPDVGLVAFGSFARREVTEGSDLDWAMIIDGRFTREIRLLPKDTAAELSILGYSRPNEVSEFGKLVSSVEIIDTIALRSDERLSLSRRLLLLFESTSLANDHVRSRVIDEVFAAYLAEETPSDFSRFAVPRYLLNDLNRFWRLMCTDYSGQTRSKEGKHWGLRSSKLNFSRKLLFVSGVLKCLQCHIEVTRRSTTPQPRTNIELIYEKLRDISDLSPLETISVLLPKEFAAPIIESYEFFLNFIDDKDRREELNSLQWEDGERSSELQQLWLKSREFHESIVNALLSEPLKDLTRGCIIL